MQTSVEEMVCAMQQLERSEGSIVWRKILQPVSNGHGIDELVPITLNDEPRALRLRNARKVPTSDGWRNTDDQRRNERRLRMQ